MKKVICLVSAAVILTGCSDGGAPRNAHINGVTENAALNPDIAASAGEPQITVFGLTPTEEDEPVVRSYDSYRDETRRNVTPADISEKYGMTIYKYDKSCRSELLYDGEYHTLGTFFGGFGATSFAVADINGDGSEELYFTFSWGSGIHRSQVGLFDTAEKQVRVYEFGNFGSDMVFAAEDGGLFVYGADAEINSFVDMELTPTEKIGELVFDGGETLLRVDETGESLGSVIFSLTD